MFQLIVTPQGKEKVTIQLKDTPTKVYAIGARLFLSKVPLEVLQNWVLIQSEGADRGGQGGAWAPPIFRTTKTSAFSTNAQSRFAYVGLDGVLRPPRLARHT